MIFFYFAKKLPDNLESLDSKEIIFFKVKLKFFNDLTINLFQNEATFIKIHMFKIIFNLIFNKT